ITVNDYLARRDAEWMGPIYDALGVSVGVIQAGHWRATRKLQYSCDVVYGTNSEFGFDYLRDNMSPSLEHCVQRGHSYAIVDEVDNILIDEARTPLIISGAPEAAADLYYTFARLAKQMIGVPSKEKLKSLGEDKDTTNGDFAYENYDKLAGMTGTALTEAQEFMKIYEMPVVDIPTNVPMVREDRNDQIYKTKQGKWKAVANEIKERNETGQPILVGTISVEISEMLSGELQRSGIDHVVLNAKPEHAQREG